MGINESRSNDESSSPSKLSLFRTWSWNGLLCFSSDDPDLFFDAEETLPLSSEGDMDLNGRIIAAKTSISSSELTEISVDSIESVEKEGAIATRVCKLRGGEQRYEPHQWHQSQN